MRKATKGLVVALLLAGACAAQEWEVGGMASYGFYRNLVASSPVGSATAGFSPGTAFGAVVGPAVGGAIANATGDWIPFLLAAGACSLALVAVLRYGRARSESTASRPLESTGPG